MPDLLVRLQSVSAQLALSGTTLTARQLRPLYMRMAGQAFDAYAQQLDARLA